MKTEEFFILVIDNITSYLFALIVAIVVYILIYRKVYVSFFDPIMIQAIGSMFGFSVVLFLFIRNSISPFYFITYLITQISFFFGFFTFKQDEVFVRDSKLILLKNDLLWLEITFFTLATAHIAIQLLSYRLVGIPLFASERLDIYSSGGGIGVLGRFLSTLSYSAIFCAFSIIKLTHKKRFVFFCTSYIVIYMLFAMLSGSRAGFLPLIIIYFLFSVLTKNKSSLFNKELVIIVVLLFCAAFLMFLKAENWDSAFMELIIRIVGYGDIYWIAYPNDVIQAIDTSKPITSLFTDVCGMYRLVPWDQLPVPLGRQLFSYLYWDANMGSNARHNVFGLAYFGLAISIFYSYFLGFIISYVRGKLFYKMRSSGIIGMFFVVIYMNVSSLESDAPYVISLFNSSFITFLVFFPFVYIVYNSCVKHGCHNE